MILELKDIGEGIGNLAFKLSLVEVHIGDDRMTPLRLDRKLIPFVNISETSTWPLHSSSASTFLSNFVESFQEHHRCMKKMVWWR